MQERIIVEKKPNPGSKEAIEIGCLCPIYDNCYGEGCGGRFVVRMDCPIHSMSVEDLQNQIGINETTETEEKV